MDKVTRISGALAGLNPLKIIDRRINFDRDRDKRSRKFVASLKVAAEDKRQRRKHRNRMSATKGGFHNVV